MRSKDIPEAPPVSPTLHLEEKKARIYENLRDLQFEYRVGKLSDEDYQKTKQSLQKELAVSAGGDRRGAEAGRDGGGGQGSGSRARLRRRKPKPDRKTVPALRRAFRADVEILRRMRKGDGVMKLGVLHACALLALAVARCLPPSTVR